MFNVANVDFLDDDHVGELQCRFEVEFEEYGYDGLDLIAGQPGLQKKLVIMATLTVFVLVGQLG